MFGDVVEKAISLCEPSSREARTIAAVAQEAKALVDKHVAGIDEIVEVVFGGSYAKGTWLRGDADVDIFFKLRPSVMVSKFEELGRSVGQKALRNYRLRLRYSEHPYVEAFVKNFRINVVPCYDVDQAKWQSAADRSPFHTEFINRKFDGEKRRQARLLKRFLKSAGIYGAEISTGGFSGYVSEVLVLKYGSFEGVLRGAADWHEREVVSVGEYDKDIVKGFMSPIIIIDPVDSRRNLGTAISPESVASLILASRAFLERPSLRFFKYKQSARYAKKLLPNVLVIEFRHKERSPDVIWGQLKKSTSAIAKQLGLADFVVLRSSCVTDEKKSAAIALLLESDMLPRYTQKKGPQVFRRNDTTSFLASKKKPVLTYVDTQMKVAMLVDRKATLASKFVKSLLENMDNSGVAKDLVSGKLQIYKGNTRKLKGVAWEAARELVSTESLIFG